MSIRNMRLKLSKDWETFKDGFDEILRNIHAEAREFVSYIETTCIAMVVRKENKDT